MHDATELGSVGSVFGYEDEHMGKNSFYEIQGFVVPVTEVG